MQVLEGTYFPRVYESMEDGISNLREVLGLSYSQEHDELIRDYLEFHGRREGTKVILEDDNVYVRISWKVNKQNTAP